MSRGPIYIPVASKENLLESRTATFRLCSLVFDAMLKTLLSGAAKSLLKFSLPSASAIEQSVVKTLLDFMTSAFADGDEDSDDDGFCGSFDNESNDGGDVSTHNTYFQLVELRRVVIAARLLRE